MDNDYSIDTGEVLRALEYQNAKHPFCKNPQRFNVKLAFGNLRRGDVNDSFVDRTFSKVVYCDTYCTACGIICTACIPDDTVDEIINIVESQNVFSRLYSYDDTEEPYKIISGARMGRFMKSLSKNGAFSTVCQCDQKPGAQAALSIFANEFTIDDSGNTKKAPQSPWMMSMPIFRRVPGEPEMRAQVTIHCRNCGMTAELDTLARYFMKTEAMVARFDGRDLPPYQMPTIFSMKVSNGIAKELS